MKKSFGAVLLFMLAAIALPAHAQNDTSQLEVYGGYDYVRFNINANLPGVAPTASYNGNGGGSQLEYNANRWLGLIGDLDGYYVAKGGTALAGAFSYLSGPRFNFRRGKVTPYAQVLFGGLAATAGIGHSGITNAFAMTAGGGIDFKLSKLVSIRPMQAEYYLTKFSDGLNNRQNNFRLSSGVVFRFGRTS
jgi:outer membrane immunogenic protein